MKTLTIARTHLQRVAIIATFFLCSLSPILSSAESITLCYEENAYPPFMTQESIVPSYRKGILLDLIDAAASRSEIDVHYIRRPWKRCIEDVAKGRADGLFAAIWLSERDSWGAFPKDNRRAGVPANPKYRLWTAEYPVFVHEDSLLEWNGEHFSNVRHGIGAPLGYVAEQFLRKLNVLNELSQSPKHGISLVSLKRLDGYVVEKNIGLSLVNDLNAHETIRLLPINFLQADWYVVFSHQYVAHSESRAKRFWESLAEVRETQSHALVLTYR